VCVRACVCVCVYVCVCVSGVGEAGVHDTGVGDRGYRTPDTRHQTNPLITKKKRKKKHTTTIGDCDTLNPKP
jgi:hypothetical protein